MVEQVLHKPVQTGKFNDINELLPDHNKVDFTTWNRCDLLRLNIYERIVRIKEAHGDLTPIHIYAAMLEDGFRYDPLRPRCLRDTILREFARLRTLNVLVISGVVKKSEYRYTDGGEFIKDSFEFEPVNGERYDYFVSKILTSAKHLADYKLIAGCNILERA